MLKAADARIDHAYRTRAIGMVFPSFGRGWRRGTQALPARPDAYGYALSVLVERRAQLGVRHFRGQRFMAARRQRKSVSCRTDKAHMRELFEALPIERKMTRIDFKSRQGGHMLVRNRGLAPRHVMSACRLTLLGPCRMAQHHRKAPHIAVKRSKRAWKPLVPWQASDAGISAKYPISVAGKPPARTALRAEAHDSIACLGRLACCYSLAGRGTAE
jgi:hypothetical protein